MSGTLKLTIQFWSETCRLCTDKWLLSQFRYLIEQIFFTIQVINGAITRDRNLKIWKASLNFMVAFRFRKAILITAGWRSLMKLWKPWLRKRGTAILETHIGAMEQLFHGLWLPSSFVPLAFHCSLHPQIHSSQGALTITRMGLRLISVCPVPFLEFT